jgi:hypothetical protein
MKMFTLVKTETKGKNQPALYSIETNVSRRKCNHYRDTDRCDAYPEKIPLEIKLGYVIHTRSYRGDQGIQFTPVGFDKERSCAQRPKG